MNSDFSDLNLYVSERAKLFVMRFKKNTSAKFLGESVKPLLAINFIQSKYPFQDTLQNTSAWETTYSLTDRYFRYCVYRRNKFFDSKLWPFIISVTASVITSILATLLMLRLGLQ